MHDHMNGGGEGEEETTFLSLRHYAFCSNNDVTFHFVFGILPKTY